MGKTSREFVYAEGIQRTMEILYSDNSDGLLVALLEELKCEGAIPSGASIIQRVNEPPSLRHGPFDGFSTSS